MADVYSHSHAMSLGKKDVQGDLAEGLAVVLLLHSGLPSPVDHKSTKLIV